MSKGNFSDDFKRDAVAQITERGYPVAEVSERLGVSTYSLSRWKKKFVEVGAGSMIGHSGSTVGGRIVKPNRLC